MFDLTLTVDNGPEPDVTPAVLDCLKRKGIIEPDSTLVSLFLRYWPRLNPPASAFPAACRGVSEYKRDVLFFLRIEDSPQLAAESFNDGGCFILFYSLVAAFRHYSRVRVIRMSDFKLNVPLPRCPQIKEKAGIVKRIRFSLYPGIASAETPCEHPESP